MLEICQAKLNKNIYDEEKKAVVDLVKKWVSSEEINFIG